QDPPLLALTSVFSRRTTGEILDADVEINAVDYQWGDLVSGPQSADDLHDLQAALTHELGHLLGLGHTCVWDDGVGPPVFDDHGDRVPNCDGASPAILATTMFPEALPGSTSQRKLSADEIRAVCEIYPALD